MTPVLWFVHGWGFDASVFDEMAKALAGSSTGGLAGSSAGGLAGSSAGGWVDALANGSAGSSTAVLTDSFADASADPVSLGPQRRYDAGYVGATMLAPPVEPFVAIAHSFGMMRVLKDLPEHCVGIVCLNGFARFSASPDFAAGTSLRLIDRMLQRLRQDPMGVVNTFRARCGAGPYAVTTQMDVDALFADLSALRDDDGRAALAACQVPIVAVGAEDDPIVPPAPCRLR
jgi:pimeloyl-[acyl-carrier protein] methyl ester esterase